MFNRSSFSSAIRTITLGIAVILCGNLSAQITANPSPFNNQVSINATPATPSFPANTAPYFSYKVATCPLNASSCSDSQLRFLMDFTASSAQPISVGSSFVLLTDLNPGDASWLMVLVDNGGDKIDLQTHSEVISPGQHNLYDPNFWLIRVNVTDLVNRGYNLQPNGALELEVVGATQNGTNVRETLRFKVSN